MPKYQRHCSLLHLLPTSTTANTGTDRTLHQAQSPGLNLNTAPGLQHLLVRVPLIGPRADSCCLPSRSGLYRGKRQLNASASGAGAPKRQPHACCDWPGEAPSAKTPLVYASRLTIRKYTGKCYSIISVNKVSTSLVISYALLRIPTNTKKLLTV